MNFATPDAFFDRHPEAAFDWDGLDPRSLVAGGALCDDGDAFASATPELIIMVGWPGAGKSTFAQTHLVKHGYEWVNQARSGGSEATR